jgi:hypothetical protein
MKRFYIALASMLVLAAGGLVVVSASLQDHIPPAIVQKVGNRAFFDSLTALAFGKPELIDTMPTTELSKNVGWTCWIERWVCPRNKNGIYLATYVLHVWIEYDYEDSIPVRMVTEKREELTSEFVRGVALHEWGHWLSVMKPDLLQQFKNAKSRSKASGKYAEAMLEWYQEELFADAFAMAVRRRGFPNSYVDPYRFYHSWISKEQVELMDSFINDVWERLP